MAINAVLWYYNKAVNKLELEMARNNRIGRNAPCPCGSGRKYKKCCLMKNVPFKPKLPPSDPDRLKAEFGNYRLDELIAILAGLQICPKNHAKIVRLEVATQLACSVNNGGNSKPDLITLKTILNSCLPERGDIGMMEDPPENLFTENIVFYGGNYIVYPGIANGAGFILRTLFEAIFHNGDDLPGEFKHIVAGASISMLTLSDEVAKRVGHQRNMSSPDTTRENIDVPDLDETMKLTKAVRFEWQDINAKMRFKGGDSLFLKPFIIEVGDKRLSEIDIEKNPLYIMPLVKVQDRIILALPGSVMTSLRHYIWLMSNKYHAKELLAKIYTETLLRRTRESLRLMSIDQVDIELPKWEEIQNLKEEVFAINDDKLAYVQLVVDDATDYKEDEPYGTCDLDSIRQKIDNRRVTIAKYLTEGNYPFCNEVLLITVLGRIGRGMIMGLSEKPANSKTILLEAEDLFTLSQLRNCDNLTLWKYAEAREKLRHSLLKPDPLGLSTYFDSYAFYINSRHSFYFGDEAKPSWVLVLPGYGRTLRIKAVRQADTHAVLIGTTPVYTTVCRRYEDDSIPIYVPENGVGLSLNQLVEGYDQPIWVEPAIPFENIPQDARILYLEINDMFSYWLWQLTPSLRTCLQSVGSNPINIKWCFQTQSSWVQLVKKPLDNHNPPLHFASKIHERTILFTIPDDLLPYLYSANNEGERYLLDALIQAFLVIIRSASSDSGQIIVDRNLLLDRHAPLGQKKKLFLVDMTRNVSLNNEYIPLFRELQEHDIEQQLDDLVNELGEKAPPIGDIEDIKQRTTLCKNIVNLYLHRIRSSISDFHWQDLMQRLISQNESIWNRRAIARANIPTSIECFGDLPSQVEILKKELISIDRIALTSRTLIEIVSAEPPMGSRKVSMAQLDRLLAITYHLVNWAMLSDDIHLGIFDHKLSILQSGRVGVERRDWESLWDRFLSAKALESTEYAIANFPRKYESENMSGETDPEKQKFEIAFKEEFGLTMTQIFEFFVNLISIAFEQRTSSPTFKMSKFKERMKQEIQWSDDEITIAVNMFALVPRKRWDFTPDGFDPALDIWPWRYNRRLSYIRRPLVVGPEPADDPLITWGPRNVDRASINLLALVLGGRYRIHPGSSEKMKSLIGEIQNNAGKEFTNQVRKWFDENTEWFLDTEVEIKPGAKLNSLVDLGDIDVLIIDKKNVRVASIECKNVNYARNPREVANELENVMGNKSGTNSWISKHLKRHEWLEHNIQVFCSVYNLPFESVRIYSLILTAEEIPSTYIRQLCMPCISLTRLKREGPVLIWTN